MQDFFRLENVTVQFGALVAVDEVNMTIPRGERRGIIGPNGAGKTTLFNAMTGVVRPTKGKVIFDGADITRAPVHKRSTMGISRTFQITNLFPRLSVSENVLLAMLGHTPRKFAMASLPSLNQDEAERGAAALEMTGLADRRDSVVTELSYGEQRQLELAMALATQPRILLLDEPAAGLSPRERMIVSDIIRALPRDLTLILIEHDMDIVMNLVDHITVLNNGKLLVEASPADIKNNKDVQDVYLGRSGRDA